MNSPDLAAMCLTAFTSVFALLTALALVMKAITSLFPGKPTSTSTRPLQAAGSDATLLAAITTTATAAYPGMKVTRIEEVR